MTQIQATVRRHVVVDSAIEGAFSVFTERFGEFKPPEHNLLSAPIAETIFAPGGGSHLRPSRRWYRMLMGTHPRLRAAGSRCL